MADLIPTQFELERSGAIDQDRLCEPATLAIGDVVHITVLNGWDLASNASALLAGSGGLGLVVKASTIGLPVRVLTGGAIINLGTSIGVTIEEIILSLNAGKMAQKADILTAAFYTRLGYMRNPDELVWQPLRTGIAAP